MRMIQKYLTNQRNSPRTFAVPSRADRPFLEPVKSAFRIPRQMETSNSRTWIDRRVVHAMDAWESCASRPPLPGLRFSPQAQQKHEQAYEDGLRSFEREAKSASRSRDARLHAQRRIVAIFPRFASIALGLGDDAIGLLTESFVPVGSGLARWARRFDPALSMPDIIQACRNAWTACGLQPLLGDPIGITPSILGYSLLYPYSDNHLDQQGISRADKLRFSRRFRDRLRGCNETPRHHHERAVWAMVLLIENQYPRLQYPQVYECLLAIHQAQEDSLAQLNGCATINPRDLLRLSCAKGGTSVLADACLSHGYLSAEEAQFAFDWGVLLQLGDDLQDVKEDLLRGSATLFTQAAISRIPLDRLVLQLLSFSDRVAEQMDGLPNGDAFLKNLLRMSWRSLIYMAVANAPEYFTKAFLAEMESWSQFRFGFLRAKRKYMSGRQSLYKIIFDACTETGENNSNGLPDPERWLRSTGEPTAEAVA